MKNKAIDGPSIIENLKLLRPLLNDSFAVFTDLRNRFPNEAYLPIPNKIVFFFNADLIQEVLKGQSALLKKGIGYKELEPLLGTGLLTSFGEHWQKNRRIISPEFGKEKLSNYKKIFEDESELLVQRFTRLSQTNEYFDICDEFHRITFNIACRCFFGENDENHQTIIKDSLLTAIDIALKRVYSIFPIPRFIPTKENRMLNKSLLNMERVIEEIIQKKSNGKNEGGPDLLQKLLNIKDTDGSLSLKDVRDEVMTFMLAGHETSSNLLIWTLYLLLENKKWFELLKEDITKYGEDSELLEKCFKESLRLRPPVPVIGRMPIKPVEIGSRVFDNSFTFGVCQMITHIDERYWTDPLSFNPLRWEQNEIKKRHPFCYFPFALGPRKCIGEEFAMMEVKIIMTRILNKFDIELKPNQNILAIPGITLRPNKEIFLRLKSK